IRDRCARDLGGDAADTSGEPEDPRSERLGTGVWIAGGATAALLVGATVTGMMALSAEDDFRAPRATIFDANAATTTFERIDAYNEARDAADRANALALTTDILLGGALIAGALTTYLIFNKPSPDQRTQLTPILGPTTAGVSIGGSL
ncbi:MAG: hypothetical protein OXT09_13990, partial [Myxococcales bacterium]|nr:hypothetical protein [Myxococcales bacterium]